MSKVRNAKRDVLVIGIKRRWHVEVQLLLRVRTVGDVLVHLHGDLVVPSAHEGGGVCQSDGEEGQSGLHFGGCLVVVVERVTGLRGWKRVTAKSDCC